MKRLWLRRSDFARIDNTHRSGDLVDVGNGVYHILGYDPLSDYLVGYPLTTIGYAMWLYDTVIDWASFGKYRLIRWLASHGLASVPEGCYPAWIDVWKVCKIRFLLWVVETIERGEQIRKR